MVCDVCPASRSPVPAAVLRKYSGRAGLLSAHDFGKIVMPKYVVRLDASFMLAATMMLSIVGHEAVAAGDAEVGEKIAQRWCAACHVVSPGQRQASADA